MRAMPRDYQEVGIDKIYRSLKRTGAALDMSDMGTGKTFKALFVAKKADIPVVVICPVATIPAWEEAARNVGVSVRLLASYHKAIRGVDQIKRGRGTKRKTYKIEYPQNTLFIFDEVHNCRDHKTWSSHLLEAVTDHQYPVLMMSATPFENPTQFRAIGHALGTVHRTKFYHWCLSEGRCKSGTFGGMIYVGDSSYMKTLHKKIAPQTDRIRIAEVGDLPEFKMQTRLVEPENRKALNEAYVELLNTLAEDTEHAIVERLRQRQIIEHEKIQGNFALADEFIQAGQRILHFVSFTDTVEHLLELHRLNKQPFGVIDGKIAPAGSAKRAQYIEDYTAGKLSGLIVNYQSGGSGLNLQDIHGHLPTTGIMNLTDSATNFRQATGRTFRDGTKSPCRFVITLAAGTVEADMNRNLNNKFKNLEALVDGDLLPRKI
jgi:superfamily II DNA or RNA helicase